MENDSSILSLFLQVCPLHPFTVSDLSISYIIFLIFDANFLLGAKMHQKSLVVHKQATISILTRALIFLYNLELH